MRFRCALGSSEPKLTMKNQFCPMCAIHTIVGTLSPKMEDIGVIKPNLLDQPIRRFKCSRCGFIAYFEERNENDEIQT